MCEQLQSSHAHQVEEDLHTGRLIKAFKRRENGWTGEHERRRWREKIMEKKLDEDLRLHFQEELQKAKLKATQELV